MNTVDEQVFCDTRRQFFRKGAMGLGTAALYSLLSQSNAFGAAAAGNSATAERANGGLPSLPHFAPRAKRAIYLSMSGAPSQIDLLDYKPQMGQWYDKDLPESIRQGQRLTTMTSGQARFPIAPSIYQFQKYDNNEDGAWVSELLPHTASMVKDL